MKSEFLRRLFYTTAVALLLLGGACVAPAHVGAQQSQSTETITLLIDATSPTGLKISGSVVITRHFGSGPANDDFTFAGMIDGKQANVAGSGSESWSAGGQAQISLDSITQWNAPAARPGTGISLNLVQDAGNVATLNGIPVALNAKLLPPGSGNASYMVTNAGQGTAMIYSLPRTGSGPDGMRPMDVAMLLSAAGTVFLALGIHLGRNHKRRKSPR